MLYFKNYLKTKEKDWTVKFIKGCLFFFFLVFILMPAFIMAEDIHDNETFSSQANDKDAILDRLTESAYHSGIIRIKLKPYMNSYINDKITAKGDKGFVITNYPELDGINEKYGISVYEPYLYKVYQNSPGSKSYRDRHEAWGFHLWYILTLDDDTDIIDAVRSFSALECIDMAEPVYRIRIFEPVSKKYYKIDKDLPNKDFPNDPQFSDQWHYHNTGQVIGGQTGTPGADISLLDAWEIEKGHPDVLVGIFDSGIDYNHEDLADNMWDDIGPDGTNISIGNHGSHVGGTVAAVTNNSTGVAGVAGGSGTGDGIRLVSLDLGLEKSTESKFIWAADNGIAISQNSWAYSDWFGNPGPMPEVVRESIDYFIEHGGGDVMEGGLVIASSGNSGAVTQYYPAFYGPVMAVGATDNQDNRSSFSTYGDWLEISAPGTAVLSTTRYNNYASYDGTSMASPHVSGVAALLLSYAYRNGFILSNEEIREILKLSADPIDHLNPGFDGMLGSGRVNAHAALLELESEMQGIPNPGNFSAEATDIDKIQLSWDKNIYNDNVMIVWSHENTFGTPQENSIYQPGDNIPGGGTVLYTGGAESYLHTGLQDHTNYYYRAFSYDGDYLYSSGRTTSARTFMAPISDFPWTEDFTANSSYRDFWEQEQVEGTHQWAFAQGDGYVITNSQCGNLNARFPSSWSTSSGRSKLITPPLNLSGHTSATLSFYYGQAQWSSNQNELKVFYRTSNEGEWILVEDSHFTDDIREWTQITLDISSDVYQIAFEGYNTGGECNVLDCIEIDAEPLDIDLYTVSLSSEPAYLSVILDGDGDYEEGDTVNISAQLSKDYQFIEWTGSYAYLLDDSESQNTNFQMPDDDVSLIAVFEDMSSPPDAPSDLEADAVSESEIHLSWNDNSDDEEGFAIERRTGQSGSWSQITETGANTESYIDDGLESGTVYYYRIRAFNDAGYSSYSNDAYAQTWDIETVFRFFNHIRGGHLYTISEIERDAVMDLPEWNYEGEVYRVLNAQVDNALPAYRFFNTTTGIHLYTIYEIERDAIMNLPEWNYEGPTFYVYPEQEGDTIPVFRFFNHVRGGHLYTISEHERDTVMDLPEWNYEGIAFYVIPL